MLSSDTAISQKCFLSCSTWIFQPEQKAWKIPSYKAGKRHSVLIFQPPRYPCRSRCVERGRLGLQPHMSQAPAAKVPESQSTVACLDVTQDTLSTCSPQGTDKGLSTQSLNPTLRLPFSDRPSEPVVPHLLNSLYKCIRCCCCCFSVLGIMLGKCHCL